MYQLAIKNWPSYILRLIDKLDPDITKDISKNWIWQ